MAKSGISIGLAGLCCLALICLAVTTGAVFLGILAFSTPAPTPAPTVAPTPPTPAPTLPLKTSYTYHKLSGPAVDSALPIVQQVVTEEGLGVSTLSQREKFKCFSLQLEENFANSKVCVDLVRKIFEWDLEIEKLPDEVITRVYLTETKSNTQEVLGDAQETTEPLDSGAKWIGRHAIEMYKSPSKYTITCETNKGEVYGKNINEAILSSRKKRHV